MNRLTFERLALDELDAVYRLAHHLTRDSDAAEDLVQEVYVRAFRPGSRAGFTGEAGAMRAWLFRIAHNAFYTGARRDAHMPTPTGSPDNVGPGPMVS